MVKHFPRVNLTIPLFIVFYLLFILRSSSLLDPDFGWHIRLGQIISKSGIPATDPFSFTMAHYPVIAHEWLTDILLAWLLSVIGIIGLALIFGALATGALYIAYLRIHKSARKWSAIPLFLTAFTLFEFVGIRPQVLTWFLLSILLRLLFSDSHKKMIVIPLLLLLWVNMHGGFAMGVLIVLLYTASRMLELKTFLRKEAVLAVICLGVTLINPYGVRIWFEIWTTMTDTGLRWSIAEWFPAFYLANFLFWVFFALSVMFVTRYYKKFSFPDLVIFYFLALASISSIRHIPLWLLAAFPMTTISLDFLAEEAKQVKYGLSRFTKLYTYLGILIFCLFIPSFFVSLLRMKSLNESQFYPVKAIQYLDAHPDHGRIFSIYGWNGYIVWKLPGERVFIHGMMPSWRDHIFPGESDNAFKLYMDIAQDKITLSEIGKVYNIRTMLIPANGPNTSLVRGGWKQVYKDSRAVIYQKIQD